MYSMKTKTIEMNDIQMGILFSIINKLLYPVDKLISFSELENIISDYTFNNQPYSFPYLFFVDKPLVDSITCLYNGNYFCTIDVESYYYIDLKWYCKKIFNTDDINHPGVAYMQTNKNKICVSGYITDYNKDAINNINIPYIHTDVDNIEYVFQSRNPPHRIHQKIIETYAPNLVYSFPYISVKPDDYSFNKRLQCYEYIKDKYNIKLLCTLLPRMLAGPREALQNMILFKNYGFKYFIFGRGKNSVGNYYKDDDAYKFCKQYESKLGINIIYTGSQSIHEEVVRASDIKHMYIDKGLYPPEDIMDPKIADILLKENTDV